MKLPVTDDGIRPAGSPNMCFYCNSPKGAHTDDCVLIKKTVVLEMIIPYVVEVPNSWGREDIEYQRNETGFCLCNDTETIFGEGNAFCLCGTATVKYVRDATEQDEKDFLPFPEDESIMLQ